MSARHTIHDMKGNVEHSRTLYEEEGACSAGKHASEGIGGDAGEMQAVGIEDYLVGRHETDVWVDPVD